MSVTDFAENPGIYPGAIIERKAWNALQDEGQAVPDRLQAAWKQNSYEAAMITAAERDKDLNGVDQPSAGAKLDAGKPRAALVLGGFAKALLEVAKVGTFGANKYTDNGWMEVENGKDRYADAGLRHFLYKAAGEELDPESGLDHLAHEAWNALARLELALRASDTKDLEQKADGVLLENGSKC